MSRFALEWAKQQHVGDALRKLVLVLLCDSASGSDLDGRLDDVVLARAAGATVAELDSPLGWLESEGLVAITRFTHVRYEGPHPVDYVQYHFKVIIPEAWRPPYILRIPRPSGSRNNHGPTAVYRLYNRAGELLYVGISSQPRVRLVAHQKRPWWGEVATREIVWYDHRQSASAEEERAIHREFPLYNAHDTKSWADIDARRSRPAQAPAAKHVPPCDEP